MDIRGAAAIVTGGASGLGRATAERLIRSGASVVVADFDAEQGERVVAGLGGSAAFARCDVTNSEQVQAAVDLAVERFGKIDILVNCAGISLIGRTVSRSSGPHDLDAFKRVINVNLVGTFDAIRLCVHRMLTNEPNSDGERGVVINTASTAAFEGMDGVVGYAASKAGVAGMTLPLARDLAGYGIRAVSIAPGAFDTPINYTIPAQSREAIYNHALFPARAGRPDEFAMLVQQIVENPMLNGETIRLDAAGRVGPRPRVAPAKG